MRQAFLRDALDSVWPSQRQDNGRYKSQDQYQCDRIAHNLILTGKDALVPFGVSPINALILPYAQMEPVPT